MDEQIMLDHEGWWFYDETWASRLGPFPSKESAQEGLKEYASVELDGNPPTPGYVAPLYLRWD